jgi:tetratricopeptide (TPR) repeat protein
MQGGFVWDDDAYVTGNLALRTPAGLARIWVEPGAVPQYYPLTFTTFWLEHQLWGNAPTGYHVTNVLLHACATQLLWLILRALALPGAWLAAAVFALHPVHVESVAWITERKNVLSGALGLGALLAYLRFADPAGAARDRNARGGAYALALILFGAALLAKTITCTIPVVIGLLLWWKRGRVARPDTLALTPFLLLGLALSLVTIWMERVHVGATGAAWALSPIERMLIAGRALWFYPATLAWPRDLSFVYPRWTIDAGVWWQYLFPLAAAATVAGLFMARARIGRGPLVAVLAYAVTIAPALGFIDVYPMRYTFVADHYQYLASVPLIALAVALAVRGAGELRGDGGRAARVAGAAMLALLAVLTWRRGGAYANEETLWRTTIATNPSVPMAHVNLGMRLQLQGRSAEAVGYFENALRLEPGDAEVHDDLGIALATLGRREEARAQFTEAIRLADSPSSHNNLGNLLAQEGRLEEALTHYGEAVRLAPGYADAHGNLANVLALAGRTAEAIAHYRTALALDPRFAEAHYNLGIALAGTGELDEAIVHWEEALRLHPGYAAAERALAAARGARTAPPPP